MVTPADSAKPCWMRKPISLVSSTPMSVAKPSKAAAPTARPPERPPASMRLEIVTPSGNLCRKIAMNTMIPSSGRTRNALAIATPSKNVCSSSPISAEVPATELTAWVSSPKWKCGVTVCWVRCTARYPASTSAGAAGPLRDSAAGSSSTIATDSMKPAPNATRSSMTCSSRTARRVTASAPSTLPAAATSAYNSALDTGQEIALGVARRIFEHFFEQARQCCSHVRPGPDAGGDQVIAFHSQILQAERRIRGPDRGDALPEGVSRPHQQIVSVFTRLREPFADARCVAWIGVIPAPFADGPPALDVPVRALEPDQQRRWILGNVRRHEHRISRQMVHATRVAQLGKPDARCADVPPQGDKFRQFYRRLNPLEPFITNSLGGQLGESLHIGFCGFERPRMNAKLEPSAEPQRAQNSQIVLLETPIRITDRADQPLLEVLLALKWVAPFVTDGMIRDRIDGEVAPRKVIHERDAELDDGMSPIRLDVFTESGDLMDPSVFIQDADGSVFDAHGNDALEHLLHLPWRRRGGEIEHMFSNLDAEETIANRTTDAPGFKSSIFELLRDLYNFGWNGQRGGKSHPQSTEPPFTFRISPVMCRANGEQRNRIGPATSSAVATRPRGIVFSSFPRPPAAYGFADISVSTHPGATQFTVIRGASSTARDFANEITAPFVAA